MGSIAAETLIQVMKHAVVDGLNDAAVLAQKGAQNLAPRDEGDLIESIKVDEASPRQSAPTSRVYSAARHAVPQHERLDYEHLNGGQAKFLESAVLENQAAIEAAIGAHVKRSFA